MKYATHYLLNGAVRCGQTRRRSWTSDPAQVTCATCKRLMQGEMK